MVSLSVKGNFFCKNPKANEIIIKMFQNLNDLDGNKITDLTFKVLKGNFF